MATGCRSVSIFTCFCCAAGATIEATEFSSLLKKEFKPQTDTAQKEVESAVKTLAEQALAGVKVISNDVVKTIDAMIAAIDKKLTDQINAIMHHDEFKKLEGAWRGLQYRSLRRGDCPCRGPHQRLGELQRPGAHHGRVERRAAEHDRRSGIRADGCGRTPADP